MSASKKFCDVGDIFEVFGKYQILQYACLCLPALFINVLSINYVFIAGDIEYRCRVPECDQGPSYEITPEWWPNYEVDRCYKPIFDRNASGGLCTNTSFSGLEACTEWIYESNDTVIAELNLACQPWKSNLIGTINSIGVLCSMIIAGWASDRFGRKPVLVFCAIAGCIGQVKTYATSYKVYIFIEFLEAFLCGGVHSGAMVAMIEIAGKRHRLLSGILYAYAIYFGETIFALVAMYIRNWKILARIVYTPPLIFFAYIFLVKESPRWLIINGKVEEAKKVLKYIANVNKININEKELDTLNEVELKAKFNMGDSVKKDSYKKIFGSKQILLRVSIASVTRFTCNFVYYGLLVNSVWLPGNKYTNFMLATVMSYPGELVALYLMNKIGRRTPLSCGYILSGLMCLVVACVPGDYTWTIISLFLIGKAVIAACYTGAVSYTMELFPTSARGTLLGICALASRIGGMLAPLTPVLTTISPMLPSICFGVSALISGLLLIMMPETKGQPLLDTMDQVKASSKAAKSKEIKANGETNGGYTEEASVT